MKAAILKEYGKPLMLEEVARPRPRASEVLIKVRACGVCGTDVKTRDGKKTGIKLPLIMGHEIAGEVVEVGADVNGIRVGDRGVIHFYLTCGECVFCRSNRETICARPLGRFGFSVDGGFAEYLSAPARNFIPIPASLPFTEASILCDAVATTYRALSKAAIQSGEQVLIMGLGGLGLHAAQIARALGASVIGVDINEAKLELAEKLGFDRLLKFELGDSFVEAVRQAAAGNPVSVILETVSVPATVEADLKVLGGAGRLIFAGYTPTPVSLPPYAVVLNELSLYGSRASSRHDVRAVIAMIASGSVVPVITKIYRLEEVNCAIDDLKAGRSIGRQVIVME